MLPASAGGNLVRISEQFDELRRQPFGSNGRIWSELVAVHRALRNLGDEFVAIKSDMDAQQALDACDRLKAAIASWVRRGDPLEVRTIGPW